MTGRFSLDVSNFAVKTKLRMNTVVRVIALQLLVRLVMKSPVDTGRFRGNWTVGVGAPTNLTTEEVDKGGGATIARGSQVIGTVDVAKAVSIFLTNHLPY